MSDMAMDTGEKLFGGCEGPNAMYVSTINQSTGHYLTLMSSVVDSDPELFP